MAIKLFLEMGSVKAVIVTGFIHSLCQACLSQARLKGSSSKLLNSDGPHILSPSRVYFVPVGEKRSAQCTNRIMVNGPSNLDLILHSRRHKWSRLETSLKLLISVICI